MVKKIFGNSTGAFYFDMFIALFMIAIFLSSFHLSERAVRLPFLIGSATLLFIAIDCFSMAVTERKKRIKEGSSAGNVFLKAVPFKKILITLCFMVGTVLLWQLAGFIVSSIIITISFGLFLGARNRKALVISAVVLTLALYWVFGVFLGVPLPAGLFYSLF